MRTGMLKRLAITVGLTGAIAAAGVVVALPASAGPRCSSGYHCVFYADIGSSYRKSYFNSDSNFTNDVFEGTNVIVNDNTWSASNSSNANRESHYYYHAGYVGGLVFCVNPGSWVDYTRLTDDGVDGNTIGQRDEISSLLLRGRTSIRCF
jgi:hypothetical protein